MRRHLRFTLALLCAATASPAAALAAPTITLALTPPGSASFATTLNGADTTGSYSLAIPVSYTSNGNNNFATNGWHITATSTTFTGTATAKTLSATASSITAFTDSPGCTLSNCTDPANSVPYPLVIPAGTTAPAAISAYSAATGTGTGGNTLSMQVSVAIPANTFSDTYQSTLTLAVIEGP
jgi:hypothetical protein